METTRTDSKSSELTTEAKLLQLKWCTLDETKKQLLVDFDNDPLIGAISFDALDAVHKGLGRAVVEICSRSRDGAGRCFAIAALVSCLKNKHIDLREAGYEDDEYPHLTGVSGIRHDTETGYFSITGINFSSELNTRTNIPRITLNPNPVVLISAATLENLWPGSNHRVLVMESLGYTELEVAEHIINGTPVLHAELDFNKIDFS